MGLVYVLTNPVMPGLVKIGCTQNDDAGARIAQLYTTGVPVPFQIEFAARVDDILGVEDALHRAFAPYRINPKREFFRLDRGSRYLSIRYTERLAAAGIEASVGNRGDAYDNALAKSVIGLFKTEVIRHAGPWRSLDDVEYARLEWVAWFNTCRWLEPLGYLRPAEYEMQCEHLAAAPMLLEHLTT